MGQQRKACKSPADFAEIVSYGHYERPWHINVLNDALVDCFNGKTTRLIVSLAPRHGKALALDTPVPTPEGWATMGSLRVGDLVYDELGRPCRVVGKSPVWRNRSVYKVLTDEGEAIIADAEHEWFVRGSRWSAGLYTTSTLARDKARRPSDYRSPQVPKSQPLQCAEIDLPIDPYVLGVWLGDGSSYGPGITQGEADIDWLRAHIEARGYVTELRPSDRGQSFVIRNDLYRVLKRNNLLKNKHVPAAYLRGSIEQRTLLLQGLMDTDGYVSKQGQAWFENTNRRIAEAALEIVRSLGVKAFWTEKRATLYGKDCGPCYRVSFYMADCVAMPRKRARAHDAQRQRDFSLSFTAAGYADTVCIEVDSPSHLFLAGKSMVPTHNSETISKHFPAWWLGMRPDDRVMFSSYESEFAETWGRKARDIFEEWNGKLFGQYVNQNSKAANRWDIANHLGGMVTVGVGGALTGRGANLLIIDDPIKNSEDARSKTVREKTWDWWAGTVRTRLEPGAVCIIVMTRWHEDDLVGRLLAQQAEHDGEKWRYIRFPAIATEDEPPYRLRGDALWPRRFTVEDLIAIRNDINEYWFAAEYQGLPHPEDGLIFRREGVRYWEAYDGGYLLKQKNGDKIAVKSSACWKFITVDLAAGEKETSDFTVMACWSVTPRADLVLLDLKRQRMQGPDKIPAMREMRDRWGADYVAIEKAGYQLDTIQNARAAGLPVVKLEAKGDKMEKAWEASIRWQNGQVYIPANASWIDSYEGELYGFPTAAHDDQVDVTAYAALEVAKRGFSPDMAYGLTPCERCGRKYTRTVRTGLNRPCPYCGAKPTVDDENSFTVGE